MSEKIRSQHQERKAILYVRQSSPYQVIHNLQGALALRTVGHQSSLAPPLLSVEMPMLG